MCEKPAFQCRRHAGPRRAGRAGSRSCRSRAGNARRACRAPGGFLPLGPRKAMGFLEQCEVAVSRR